MKRAQSVRGYQGGYLLGFISLGVVVIRAITFYADNTQLNLVIILLAVFGLLYAAEPIFSARHGWFRWFYIPLQAALVLAVSNMEPFLDISSILYAQLGLQVVRLFKRRNAIFWIALFIVLLVSTLVKGMGWAPGLALGLMILAGGAFLVSYDVLYSQTRSDQAESQLLLMELRQAHEKLEAYADQAEELAAVQERNRLAQELHETISQLLFSIRLNSRAAQKLVERDSVRLVEQLDRLQDLTASALQQLRALITQLHPQQKLRSS